VNGQTCQRYIQKRQTKTMQMGVTTEIFAVECQNGWTSVFEITLHDIVSEFQNIVQIFFYKFYIWT